MTSPMWSYLFGLFLIIHGIGHLAGFSTNNRIFATLWLLGLLGFVAAGLAFFRIGVPHAWWSALAVASAAASTFLILAFIPTPGPKLFALIANLGILMAVLWWHWPTPIRGS